MTARGRWQTALAAAAGRQDLMIVALLVATILLMILPLPTLLVDALIACNMTFAVLLLMVAVYLRSPLELSVLPSVILIATVFRLALSIGVTRLILMDADAGAIIQTFGEFVIGGSLAIGLVIFLIITVVQFVVVVKGAERVAEVAARFTLDALPGKQMSIDGELRAGDIDLAEATRRRQTLEKESQLYGAMDGAMKFVKGDAIAGLIIVAVNLIGGLAVGMLQHGMSLGQAMHVYSLLTIGDGLVSQIPALFVAITSGTIVTRVTTSDSRNLGADIAHQIGANPTALLMAAGVVALLGFIPGFPTLIFLAIAAAMAGGVMLRRRRALREAGAAEEEVPEVAADETVTLHFGPDLMAGLGRGTAERLARDAAEELEQRLGVPFPVGRVGPGGTLPPDGFRIDIDGVPVEAGTARPGRILLRDDPMHLDLLGLAADTGEGPGGVVQHWIDARHEPTLAEAGIGHATAEEIVAEALTRALRRYAPHFLGIQETQAFLKGIEATRGDLVREAQRHLSVNQVADVFRRLLEEGISLRNHRLVLETLAEWGQKEQDVILLTEYVRGGLKRQICHAHADERKVIHALILDRGAEEVLRQSIRQTTVGAYLALPEGQAEELVDTIRGHLGRVVAGGRPPVILPALDTRRFLRQTLARNQVEAMVLSYAEIAPDYTVQPVAVVRLTGRRVRQDAEAGVDRAAAE
ncbi:type III secretion system export apparatus subunit SctV [Inquilinus sp. Marseille-Q2685]|uniref:type III secretion system export apparatus subunit SctV n=1 Tax=Inquilinus sp. Marseille-Q2685 TaxID=2866581 RepID=UPI001CE45D68|nr:type III secretion system export apparatus subunit SctV [Inquilinus sp. Marseille-Q2685]